MRPGKGGGGGKDIITDCHIFWSNWLSNFKYLDYYNNYNNYNNLQLLTYCK